MQQKTYKYRHFKRKTPKWSCGVPNGLWRVQVPGTSNETLNDVRKPCRSQESESRALKPLDSQFECGRHPWAAVPAARAQISQIGRYRLSQSRERRCDVTTKTEQLNGGC